MTNIVLLHSVTASVAQQPETLDDIVVLTEDYCEKNGFVLEDLQDEFGSTHLCGFLYGTTLFVAVPEVHVETEDGSAVSEWTVHMVAPDGVRPVAYAVTEALPTKIAAVIAKLRQGRKPKLRLVA